MTYFAGFVAAVPTANKQAYKDFGSASVEMFKSFGATRLVDAWEDDVRGGEVTDFRRAVQAKPDEVIVFSWQEFPSRAVADAASARMMDDPRMAEMGSTMPFDGARMIYGGFEALYDHGAGGKTGYFDGSLLPVKTARKDDYLAQLKRQAVIFEELGALRFVDAWGDNVPDGTLTDFKKAVNATADETVVFSFLEWPSKAARDAAWEKVMNDPRMMEDNSPGDEHRRVFGGFTPLLDV